MLTRSTRILFPCVCIVFAFVLLSFGSSSKVSATEDVDYNVSIAPSLNLTIPSNPIIINLDPSSKTFDSKDFSVVVATNNRTGYTLTLSTPNDNTNLNRDTASDGVSAIMPTLDPGTYTQATFTADKWGYKINSNTSIPSTVTSGYVPFVSGNTLMESDTAVNHDEAELSLAAKIDYLQPSGSYSTTLNFNIVAHPQLEFIQDLNPALCTTTPMQVLDIRDYQEYTIQKLADGNCWMMDNLNLGAVELKKDLTSQNTNISNTIDIATFDGYKKTTSSSSNVNPEYIPVSGTDTTVQSPYGTLYNFCAASAGTKCGNTLSGNAQYDLCPAGWRLPTGGNSGEYYKVYTNSAYNSYAKTRTPAASGGLAYALSGRSHGAVEYTGLYAYLWSSTLQSSTRIYNVGLNTSAGTFDPATTAYTWANLEYGFPMRCILDATISDITNMQDITSNIVANTPNGETATLKDSRDGQEYTVAKINGNLWMTRNLAIGCNGTGSTYGSTITSKTLTSSNTNISAATWNTPTNSLTLGSSYDDPRIECSDAYGAWYNYAAITAGTITGSSNNTNATYDICPKGWRLPTYSEQTTVLSYSSEFAVTKDGYWTNGSLDWSDTTGFWLSSTAATSYTNRRWGLLYNWDSPGYVGNLKTYAIDNRSNGFAIRCIANY